MAWNDPSEIVVAGTGQVYAAPVGTALPTTGPTQALNAAFSGLGYHTEDGVSISADPDVNDFMAWQSRQPVRRELNGQELQAQFTLMQFNEVTVPLAFGGGTISDLGGGAYKYAFPDDSAQLQERSLIVDIVDGSTTYRFVFPRGTVTDAVESQFQRTDTAGLPITFKALAPTEGGSPGYFLTNAAGFAAGS